ncbi:hypothetical protein ABIB73_004158 [Bradyrhizobium sp. F1.4.3]
MRGSIRGWYCIGREVRTRGENPSPGFASRSHPLPQGERVHCACGANYGVIEIGEKSMNQLFGWITPVTFGLMARGPTSWAT